MKNITLTLYVLLGICTSLNAQQTPIDWVHGLNSAPRFWEDERALFEGERQINAGGSTNGGYNTNNGVVNFATALQNATNNGGVSLAIGHSMGGLAIREVVRQEPCAIGEWLFAGHRCGGQKL